MIRLGIIEESLENRRILELLKKNFISQRKQHVQNDEYTIWHVNEYHINEEQVYALFELLKENIKETWYIHAFSTKSLYVIMRGKWFEISLYKNETWEEMIEYGMKYARVERYYLESIQLNI